MTLWQDVTKYRVLRNGNLPQDLEGVKPFTFRE